jgi:hypothetical protein
MTTQAAGRPNLLPWLQALGGLVVAALSAGAWFAWMGGDAPYEIWQVSGCVGSLLVVLIAALLLRVRWYVAAPAMTVAFTAAWTATASAADDTGLFGVGALLVLAGTAAGTAVVSLIVAVLRRTG